MSLRDYALPMRGRLPFLSASRLFRGWVCLGLLIAGGPSVLLSADSNLALHQSATQSSTLPACPPGCIAFAPTGQRART